jgi:hypothetical protein
MLNDEQLIERLRSEFAPLRPGADLAERVREQAGGRVRERVREQAGGRVRRSRPRRRALAVAAGALAAVAVGTMVFVLAGQQARPSSRPITRSHVSAPGQHSSTPALASARPGAGPVTCRGRVCHQGRHLVRNPGGSTCAHGVWIGRTSPPETIYDCGNQPVEGY